MAVPFPSQNPAGLSVGQLFGQHPNVQSWGAKGDIGEANDGNITGGSNVFSSNQASFGTDPYGNFINEVGKSICIAGAGPTTGNLWPTVQVNTFGSPSNYNVVSGNENWANVLGPMRSQGSAVSIEFNVANCGDPGIGPGNDCAWIVVGTNTASNLVGNNTAFTGLTIVHGGAISGTGGTSGSFLVLTVQTGHGLVAGQKCRVFGNSAGNGIWRIISVTATTITIPVLYSGGASVAGGQVAPIVGWQAAQTRVLTPGTTFAYYSIFLQSAIPTVGGVAGKPASINITILGNGHCLFGHIVSVTNSHTVVLDVTATSTVNADSTYPYYTGQRWYYATDDTTAIETAIASMPTPRAPYGTMFFPAAGYLISRQIFIPQYCRIQGANNMNTRLLANVGQFSFNLDPVGKAFIGLGSFSASATSGYFVNGPSVASRIEDMDIDCNDIQGMGAINAGNIQETSGVFRCLITAWHTFGISCGDGTFTGPYQNQNWSLQDLWIFPSEIAIEPRAAVIAPPFLPPLHAPTLTITTGGSNVFGATVYVVFTYLGPNGESAASLQSSLLIPAHGRVIVTSPPSATGVSAWNCYIGTASGVNVLQPPYSIAIGTNATFDTVLLGGTLIGPAHWYSGTFAMTVDTTAGLPLAPNYIGNCVSQQGQLNGNRGQELVTPTSITSTTVTGAFARTHDAGEQIITSFQPTALGVYLSISANPIVRLTAIGGTGFGWGCGVYAGGSTLTLLGLHVEACNAGLNIDLGSTVSVTHMTGNFNVFDTIRLANATVGAIVSDIRAEGGANSLTDLTGTVSYKEGYIGTYTRDDNSPVRHTIYGTNPYQDIEQWTAQATNFGAGGCCIGSRSEFRNMSWTGQVIPGYSPNCIAINTAAFANPIQGGIISVNSRYVGQSGAWEQTTLNAYNQAMFVTMGAARFAVSFGPATRPAGTYDPQPSLSTQREFRVDELMGTRMAKWNFGDDFAMDYEGAVPSCLLGNQISTSAFKIQQTYFGGAWLQILGNAAWPGTSWTVGLQIDSAGNIWTNNFSGAVAGQLLKYNGAGLDKASEADVMTVLFGGTIPPAGSVTFNGTNLLSGAAAVPPPTVYNQPLFWTGLGGTWGAFSPGGLIIFAAAANTWNPGDMLTVDSTYALKKATGGNVVLGAAGSNVLTAGKLVTIDGSNQLINATSPQVVTAASGANTHTAGNLLTTDSSGNLKDAGAGISAGTNTLATGSILTVDSSGFLIDATVAQMFAAIKSGPIALGQGLAYGGTGIIQTGEIVPLYVGGITLALGKLTVGGTNGSVGVDIHGRIINNTYTAPT